MVLRAVPFKVGIDLVVTGGSMNLVYHRQVLQHCLMKNNGKILGEEWILHQDTPPVHLSIYTKEWL